MDNTSPYQEILSVIKAGLQCAGSLKDTAQEASALLQAGELSRAQESYAARGEVLTMMARLDGQLTEMMSAARSRFSGKEWAHLVEMGSRLRDLLEEANRLDLVNMRQLEEKSHSIAGELGRLRQGRQVSQSYQSPRHAKADYQA